MSWTDALDALRTSLPNFEERAPQTALAQFIEKVFANGERGAAQAGTGCIQGDALIAINRAGIGKQITLRDLVIRQSGARTPGQQRYWDLSIPTMVQREVDGVVRLAELKSAWFSGVKTTYTVTTDSGRTIRATDEHPFFTERGWLRLDELVVGDEVHVRGQQAAGRDRLPKAQYRTRSGLVGHPYATRRLATRHAYRYPLHRLVTEANLNGLELDDFLSRLRDGAPHQELQFIDPEVYAVHHIDLDSLNNDLGNLKVLTHEEHHRLHAELGKTESVLYKIVTEKVVSVELYGEEETYDIEVADDPHNFLANGFVVHNTGKSFANLIPAIEHARATGLPVVISTGTKALQAQYSSKDVPFLQEHLGTPFTAVQLKGRSNYVCRAAVDALNPGDILNQSSLLEEIEANPEMSGDLDDLITDIDIAQKSKITVSSEECPGKSSCPFGEICFAEKAKVKARDAQVIIVNHHLLMTDTMIRLATIGDDAPEGYGVLPSYGALVVDEAHELEEIATSVLGNHFTEKSLLRFSADAGAFLDDQKLSQPLDGAAHRLFTELAKLVRRDRTARLTFTHIEELTEHFGRITDELRTVIARIKAVETGGDKHRTMRKQRMVKRAGNLLGRFVAIVLAESDQLVRWVAKESFRGQDTIELHYAPMDVSGDLRKALWDLHPSVLLSATLAVGRDFSYITRQLGFDNARTFDAGTPFDYPNQAAFFCPTTDYDPKSGAEWSTRVAVAIEQLVLAAGGGALLLFTSRKELEAAWDATHELLEDDGITVLKQVAGGNNRTLGEQFKADRHSTLFALKSFMTGFDAQGDTCRLVVLNKLPFANPSDVILAARAEEMDKRAGGTFKPGGSFYGMAVPSMTLVLLQAFGRLIRTQEDQGMVILLDDRLHTKAYGKKIQAALPPARSMTTLGAATGYLRSLRGE